MSQPFKLGAVITGYAVANFLQDGGILQRAEGTYVGRIYRFVDNHVQVQLISNSEAWAASSEFTYLGAMISIRWRILKLPE